MKRFVLFGLLILFISSAGFSQSFGDIYQKSIESNSAIPYSFLREADVIWSKRLWRLIDMREKMNLPPVPGPATPGPTGTTKQTALSPEEPPAPRMHKPTP